METNDETTLVQLIKGPSEGVRTPNSSFKHNNLFVPEYMVKATSLQSGPLPAGNVLPSSYAGIL